MAKQKRTVIRQGVTLTDKPEPLAEGIVSAHDHCRSNRAEIESSSLCGCFYCERIFPAAQVAAWLAVENTATCPHCGIDSVIGSASGLDLTKEFLRKMHDFWF